MTAIQTINESISEATLIKLHITIFISNMNFEIEYADECWASLLRSRTVASKNKWYRRHKEAIEKATKIKNILNTFARQQNNEL